MSSSPYAPAARMLTKIWTEHVSIKAVAYDQRTGSLKCSKATYAQVCHVLESQVVLQKVLERLGESAFGHVRNEGLLYVLLYELLLGPNQKLRGGGALKRQLVNHEPALRRAIAEICEGQAHAIAAPSTVTFPRYVRINPFGQSDSDAVASLKRESREIYADAHVPNVLVLPPGTTLHDHKLSTAGDIVLQDKSSCFSALCLIHGNQFPLYGDVLDACAAPGNKTSHLAALLLVKHDSSPKTVFALDRSSKRLDLLQRRLSHLGIRRNHPHVKVSPVHTDFLKTMPSQYDSVRGILLDPSCSGSGIFTLPDRRAGSQDESSPDSSSSRLKALSNFQLTALRHAMSFPNVQRIVYSTCSLYEVENECVVSQAIAKCSGEWKIVAPFCLSHWKRRGRVVDGLTSEQARCLIRADRDDETNGFFVCYLERCDTPTGTSTLRQVHGGLPAWTPPVGLAFYEGQFTVCELKPGNKRKSRVTKTLASGTEPNSKTASPTPTQYSHGERSARHCGKKRMKKVAWKQRQKEEKRRRLESRRSV